MFKKFCVTSIVVAAAGISLMAAPASADTHNSSWNHGASQSGNNFGNIFVGNVSGAGGTNVTTINGNSVTSTHGSRNGVFHH